MARITVEDCIDKFPSRFELVLVASNRARKLYSGENPTVEIDNDKRRISLGLKQTKPNPWIEFSNKYGIGDKVEGIIKSITDFGIFVGLEGDIDGLIHLSDISDDEDPKNALEDFKKDQKLECIVFAIDAERERISLKLSE